MVIVAHAGADGVFELVGTLAGDVECVPFTVIGEPVYCPHCKGRARFNVQFDKSYCPACDQWIGDTCDHDCVLCKARPYHPSGMDGGMHD